MNISADNCSVVILAGGQGTRLSSRSGDLPKAMVNILGKPCLHHQIDLCLKYGFTKIALLVHHRYEKIYEYFGDGSKFGVCISYVIEEMPRGTAGALRDALPFLAKRFLVMYGDTYIDVDLQKFWNRHELAGSVGTLFLHPNDHPQDSDIVDIDRLGAVRSILPYPHPQGLEARNLVNAALYVFEREGLEDVTPIEGKADIAKDMFPRMLALGRRLHGYISPEYIKDMGTPERLDKVEGDIMAGLPDKLSSRHLRSAVFLDRDGTLIREVNHLTSPEQLELLPGVANAIRRLNRNGILSIVITNQPVVARGDITFAELDQIHARLETQLGINGSYIDGLYFCPHHPQSGFKNEVPELKIRCRCRKPEPGLIERACQDFNIDHLNSWMIGDTTSDIEAGRRAGVRTILLRSGFAGSDVKFAVKPDYVFPDLADAVNWILDGRANFSQRISAIAENISQGKRLVLIGGLARAGKSFVAQVLKESLQEFSIKAHVISLDGWLKPKEQRSEGSGVCSRYDLGVISTIISSAVQSHDSKIIHEPLYDRINRVAGKLMVEHSIGPKDIIILEGVPALLMRDLAALLGVVKIYVDVDPTLRTDRLAIDYAWRGEQVGGHYEALAMREDDEVPVVMQSRNHADFIVLNKR